MSILSFLSSGLEEVNLGPQVVTRKESDWVRVRWVPLEKEESRGFVGVSPHTFEGSDEEP